MSKYKSAGVDVEAGYEAVRQIRPVVEETFGPEVLDSIGGFGSLYALNTNDYKDPVLVSGTDGVGTKLKLAFALDKHDTVGIDCVAMCVNDIVCGGARPLYFLDYIACGKNKPGRIKEIVKGIAEGCLEAGCALVGGETAEMPGFYPEDEYDLAGFVTGIVDREKIIDGSEIKVGDVLYGLPSSGVHSNGFSLVRKIFGPDDKELLKELLTPTRIYVKPVLSLIEKNVPIKGIAHITGGGFIENIPRILPGGLGVKIDTKAYPVPDIFKKIQKVGEVSEREMYNTFNMGIGMVLVLPKPMDLGIPSYRIGEVIDREGVLL